MALGFSRLRLLGTVLSSSLFFLVSCSTGLYAGFQILPVLDERDIAAGDEPHRMILVAVSRPETTNVIMLDHLNVFLDKNEDASLLLSPGQHQSDGFGNPSPGGGLEYRYSASEVVEGEQRVELEFTDYDDRRGRYRYIATSRGVTPTFSSYVHGMEVMASALPFALLFAIVLRIIGKLLLRKSRLQALTDTSLESAA